MTDSTPPNWPIYNVTFSELEIQSIVDRVYPKARLVSVQELPKGKSFNNRIYFLSIRHGQDDFHAQDVVLKVIGRFFDARKVQNEVGSLLLLQRFCPQVPVPQVLAWSNDGLQITAIENGVYAVLSDPVIDPEPPTDQQHPWIMMSKCPGRILTEDDMKGEHCKFIADQLASMVKSWREDIPPRQEVGNIRLQSAGFTSSHALHGLDIMVTDPLLTETQPESAISTLQQYYKHVLADQIHKVNSNDVFTRLRSLVAGDLQTFQTESFPHLPCFTKPNLTSPRDPDSRSQILHSLFTHQDLSPRNVLVSDPDPNSPPTPTITGILDFEFAGFFPPEEEYLTCLGRQSTDWPPTFINLVLRNLEEKGIAIPNRQGSPCDFDRLLKLIELIEYVAPWWLQDGHISGKELEVELEKAGSVVRRNIDELTRSIGET